MKRNLVPNIQKLLLYYYFLYFFHKMKYMFESSPYPYAFFLLTNMFIFLCLFCEIYTYFTFKKSNKHKQRQYFVIVLTIPRKPTKLRYTDKIIMF